MIKIESTVEVPSIESARKHIGTSHSYSIIGLVMLDPRHTGCCIELKVDSFAEMQYAADIVIAAMLKCESNKVYLRSCMVDNTTFLDTYQGCKLEHNNNTVGSVGDFPVGHKVVLDINLGTPSYVYKIYRWNDTMRTLKITLVDQE